MTAVVKGTQRPGFTERVLDLNGRKVQYLEGGAGPPLVFLHGGEGSLTKMQAFLEPFLPEFRVIAPLHPGFGESDLPPQWDSVEDLSYHYLDVFDRLELHDVRLAGLSLGGWIAAELAVMQPRRFAKLALVAALGIRVDGIVLINPFMQRSENLLELLYADPEARAQARPQTPEDALQRLKDKEVAARFTFSRLYNPKLLGRLYRISAPTLVVWGERDALLPLDYGRAYAAAIPNARFTTVDSGHALPIERPIDFATTLNAFFRNGD
jgi:pimeloyl-ACP methyl ester carboxylesterase